MPTLITVFRDNYEAPVRAPLISLRHRVYEIGARTRAHENRLERAGSTTWCARSTSDPSKAADAVFVMLMHSLLTPYATRRRGGDIRFSSLLPRWIWMDRRAFFLPRLLMSASIDQATK